MQIQEINSGTYMVEIWRCGFPVQGASNEGWYVVGTNIIAAVDREVYMDEGDHEALGSLNFDIKGWKVTRKRHASLEGKSR